MTLNYDLTRSKNIKKPNEVHIYVKKEKVKLRAETNYLKGT
jgi:hypothetical protein